MQKSKSMKLKKIDLKKIGFRFSLFFLSFILVIIFLLLIYLGDFFINYKSGKVKSPLVDSYVIVSNSMVPTINVGDIIIIKREKVQKYNVGDIITFSSTDDNYKGLIITHRIVEKKKNNNNTFDYITKGDHNRSNDLSVVKDDDIYGKMILKIPKNSLIYYIFAKPVIIIMCIFLPVFGFIFYFIIKVRK